jgi:hypothetical protein
VAHRLEAGWQSTGDVAQAPGLRVGRYFGRYEENSHQEIVSRLEKADVKVERP